MMVLFNPTPSGKTNTGTASQCHFLQLSVDIEDIDKLCEKLRLALL
jgi:hypothetical protein